MSYEKLISGTDIRGSAIDTGNGVDLTDEAVIGISAAFAYWLKNKYKINNLKIAIGHDSRLTAERLFNVVLTGLSTAGGEIYDCGLCSTPSVFMMTQFEQTNTDGAIMITASHHSYEKNGFKFFTKEGGVTREQLKEIVALAATGARLELKRPMLLKRDFLRYYCDFLVKKVRDETASASPLRGKHIVVDAGHGAGGFFVKRVLMPLGADVRGSQFLNPDGSFPAHSPNPEDNDAIESLRACVLENGADLGIIFDTDVDRAAIVLGDGTTVNRNTLIALVSAIVLSEMPGATIVTDSETCSGLSDFIAALGGIHHCFKRGYKNVIEEAKRLNDEEGRLAPVAIETSGHAAFMDNYFLDDGAYLVVKILIALAVLDKQNLSLAEMCQGFNPPAFEKRLRVVIDRPDWAAFCQRLMTRLAGLSERVLTLCQSYEGVRAYIPYADGYFLARQSVHDPVIALYVESTTKNGLSSILSFLRSFFSGAGIKDLSDFDEHLAVEEKTDDFDFEQFIINQEKNS